MVKTLLQHSQRGSQSCVLRSASELGLNPKLAKRAGLLHDIGKVWPEEPEKPHAILGMELAQKVQGKSMKCVMQSELTTMKLK